MATAAQDRLRFVPSAVEGLLGVTEAAVFPDRLALLSEGKWEVMMILKFFSPRINISQTCQKTSDPNHEQKYS